MATGQSIEPAAGSGGMGADLFELSGVLRRRRGLILGTVGLGTGLALLVGLARVPQYSAEATLRIEGRQSHVFDADAVLDGLSAEPGTVETEINVIRSRRQVDRVLEALQLAKDPEFNPAIVRRPDGTLAMRERGTWRQLVSWLPQNWLIADGVAKDGAAEGVEITSEIVDEVAGNVARRIEVQRRGRSFVIGVRASASDPRKAAQLANAAARLYVEQQLETKRAATRRASAWLEERLEALRAELQTSEETIQRYRAAHGLTRGAVANLSDRERYDLRRELIDARGVLAEKQATLSRIRQLQSQDDSLDSVPEVMASPLFVELWRREMELLRTEADYRGTYGENHPRMQALTVESANLRRKMIAEIERTMRGLEIDSRVLESRIVAIEDNLDALDSARASDGAAEVRLHQLEREAQANRQLYESFLRRYKETREQQEIVEPDVRIVSEARPPTRPSSPGPHLFALAGFTVSSLAGVLLALLLERLDHGVRSGKQLERAFGLACLGLIPDVRRQAGDLRPHQYLLEKPFSQYAEAVRLAHTALRSRVEGPCKILQVTSAVPDEGKTTFAVSLATSLAQNGLRVLLFDLDLRHPTVLREIPLGEAGGFEQFTASERPRDEMVQHDPESGIDLITFQRQRLNPLRLLGSRRMRLLIDLLRSSYDYVIVDGPPVLGVSDSKVLTEMADAVLFVVRWGETTIDAVEDALKELAAARATLGGAVVVQVDVDRHAQYGFGGIDSYMSRYSDYYVN
jgi:capsular exopolysaccharide synthesis family protein